jgi:hypothetical protein
MAVLLVSFVMKVLQVRPESETKSVKPILTLSERERKCFSVVCDLEVED